MIRFGGFVIATYGNMCKGNKLLHWHHLVIETTTLWPYLVSIYIHMNVVTLIAYVLFVLFEQGSVFAISIFYPLETTRTRLQGKHSVR